MGPLLATKLHVPRRRRGLVPRPRLTERLGRGEEAALTLVSAPAGFGKTTVLTDWLTDVSAGRRPVAWLSLDARDNDPALFWSYLVAALQTVAPDVGAAASALLQEPRSTTDAVLATLVNDLAALPGDVVLVLDDYHVIDSPQVQDGMAFLLAHRPAQLHLVIAGRADPPLPLARLRGGGELVELRAADLRFTPEEAAAYLTGIMGLALTADDVAALESRTEGWIAALQLAALSMQGRPDLGGFIAGFAGDDRYIVDYLVEEVLARQPERVRSFLLQTSVLGRLSGPLCDAVTGQDDGRAVLAALERDNLFVVPLDDRRRWYRYHHLFADVLQAHLLAEDPHVVADLHRRASAWYERNGDASEAIGHLLAAGDHERAATLIEVAGPALSRARQEATLRRWLEALPIELFATRPVLSVQYAGALMSTGEATGVEARLRDAERWLDPATAPSADMVVVDDEGWRRLPGEIAMYRAGQALLRGEVAASMTHARRALELAGAEDHGRRGGPAALLGLAHWRTGDLEAAHRWYAEGMAHLDRAGYSSDVVGGAVTLADLRIAQGRLHEAMRLYERGLLRAERTTPPLRGAADMHVGMAALLLERNDLDAARSHLRRSQELGEHAGLPKNPYRQALGLAMLRQADGDLGGALDLLDEAERRYDNDFSPDLRPIPAVRARMWLDAGRVDEALDWAAERGLSADDDPDYVHEYEHLTLARVLLARGPAQRAERSWPQVAGLLQRLLRAAEEGERTGSVIEVLVVQARAAQARGDVPAALASLERALSLAEPEGHVRTFVAEGPAMITLLRAAATRPTAPEYARRLVDAVAPADDGPARRLMTDPLSNREIDVLRLLGTDLDGPAIARELFVSLNTVRTHTKAIYAKLGVNSRRAAVRRARELDLVSGPHRS